MSFTITDNNTMTEPTTKQILAGTAHGAIDNKYVYLSKCVRIPRTDILAVSPSADGNGAIVVTERGAMRVCEDYSALMYHLYGAVVQPGGAK